METRVFRVNLREYQQVKVLGKGGAHKKKKKEGTAHERREGRAGGV